MMRGSVTLRCGASKVRVRVKPSVSIKDRGVAIRYNKTPLHVVPSCGLAYALTSMELM